MALGDSYAEVEDLEDRLGPVDPGTYERLLDAASRRVEAFTRRQFNKADEATVRRYRALDCERVAVHDFYTLDELAVEVSGVAWDVETMVDPRPWSSPDPIAWPVWPSGGSGDEGEDVTVPYSDLFAVGRSWPWSRRGLIAVTARWGWPAVPAGIIEATLDVAEVLSVGAGVGNRSTVLRSETIGADYSYTFGAPLFTLAAGNVPRELLKAVPYRRKQFGIA